MSLIHPHSSASSLGGITSSPLRSPSAPSALEPTSIHDLDDSHVAHHGKYADIYRIPATDSTKQIACKVFRVVPTDTEAVARADSMIRALLLQQSQIDLLRQDNVSPIRVTNAMMAGQPVPAIAVPWYKHGNILVFLQRNPNVDKLDLVIDLACGLAGLHSIGIIHGNLHPGNVMITDNRRACLADVRIYATAMQRTHGHRLPAPSQWPYKPREELLDGVRTMPTDVYSFACTVYSLYTGDCPVKRSAHVPSGGIYQLVERGHGALLGRLKPAELNGSIWSVLTRCWAPNPASRPTMNEVETELRVLKGLLELSE